MLSFLTACAAGATKSAAESPTELPVSPLERTVGIEVLGCGFAPPTAGTGVVLSSDLVLVSGHVVAQSDGVSIVSGTTERQGAVVAFDAANDLALIETSGLDVVGVEFADGIDDAEVSVITQQPDEDAVHSSASIVEVRPVEIQEVGGNARNVRDAFSIDFLSRDGDSGAGVWNDDGALLGVVFAQTIESPQLAFVTASSVIEAFEANTERVVWECDPTRSRLAFAD